MHANHRESPHLPARPSSQSWFHDSPAHAEALARLFFVVEQRRHCGLVIGPEGTGKSLLFERLSHELLRSQREVALLDLRGTGGHELLWELAANLRLAPAADDSPWRLWRLVSDSLRGLSLAGRQTVLLFDHLDRAQPDCSLTLERLLSCCRSTSGGLTMILATRGSVDRSQRLLLELCDLRIDMPALDRHETADYVRGWLRQAGAASNLFDEAALDRLYQRTRGVPRAISRVCELSLLAATSHDRAGVSRELVDDVVEELPVA